jgi:hypothetical protein
MTQQDAPALAIARTHIEAWSHHDWEKTRALLAPTVHAVVTTTQPMKATAELTGIDAYMEPKIKAAQLIESGSVQVISTIGDEKNGMNTSFFHKSVNRNEQNFLLHSLSIMRGAPINFS